MTADATLLRATDLTTSYAGVQALRRASFELRAGEVYALVGENGAGEGTLVRILTGAVRPDAGEVRAAGELVAEHSPRAAKARGIAAIHQQPALFPELTVAEKLALGVEASRGRGWAGRWGRVARPAARGRGLGAPGRAVRVQPDEH